MKYFGKDRQGVYLDPQIATISEFDPTDPSSSVLLKPLYVNITKPHDICFTPHQKPFGYSTVALKKVKMSASHIQHPTEGTPIQALEYGKLDIPNQPIIPFIEGDGVGAEITAAMLRTLDHIVQKTYQNERQIHWMEIYAGEKATRIYGEDTWLPKETLDAINTTESPSKALSTPIGQGRRSLNVTLRQELDLYYATTRDVV